MKRVTVVLVGLLAALAFAATAAATITPTKYCVGGANVLTAATYVVQGGDEEWIKYSDAAAKGGYWSYKNHSYSETTHYSLTTPAADKYNPVFHTVKAGACTAPAAFVPEIPNVFLCYSAFQTNPGVWPATEAAALIKAGYWSPYAVPNTATGGTNIGGYHLVCNLATGQSAGTSVLGGAGEVYGAGATKDVTNVPGHYSVVGP